MHRYFEHADFADALANGLFTPSHSSCYIAGLFRALEHIHAHGFVHRDIKPTNALYNFAQRRTLVIDFGLVQCCGGDAKPVRLTKERLSELGDSEEAGGDARAGTGAGAGSSLAASSRAATVWELPRSGARSAPKGRCNRDVGGVHATGDATLGDTGGGRSNVPPDTASADVIASGRLAAGDVAASKCKAGTPAGGRSSVCADEPPVAPTEGDGSLAEFVHADSIPQLMVAGTLPKGQGAEGGRRAQQHPRPIGGRPCGRAQRPRLPSMAGPREGTRSFRAPEVLLRKRVQGPQIDVWSAGVIMLSLLTRRHPVFQAEDDNAALGELLVLFGALRAQSPGEEMHGEEGAMCSELEPAEAAHCGRLVLVAGAGHAEGALGAAGDSSAPRHAETPAASSSAPIVPSGRGTARRAEVRTEVGRRKRITPLPTQGGAQAWEGLLRQDGQDNAMVTPQACELVDCCLRFHEDERISATDALQLDYLR